MAHMDDQIGLPRSALAALPLLILPAVAGALLLIAFPGQHKSTFAIAFAVVAVSWYLLGGAISLGHGLRRMHARRALAAIRSEVARAPEPVWVCDAEGQVLYQNVPAIERFGDIIGHSVTRLLSRMRADAPSALDEMRRKLDRGGCAEIALEGGAILALYRSADAPLQIWSCHDPAAAPGDDEIALALTPCPDDDPLDDFDTMPVALIRLFTDGRIQKANAAAKRLLELPAVDTRHPHLGAVLEGPGRPIGEWLADMLAGRAALRPEMLRQRMGTSRDRYFQVTLAPDKRRGGGLIAVLTDASEMKRLEAQFVQSQKMQAIGQLAGGVAHDFNNLLTAISGHCDLLMLRRDKTDPDYADLDQISQNANRAAALVGQLLAFSRKQTLCLQDLDLRDTLADLTHLLNRLVGERIALNITHDAGLNGIRADKRQLEQVIMNLVVNARDAMPSGGEITIQTRNTHLAEPKTRDRATLPKGSYVLIEVRDQGCGIAPDNVSKIFEPFFTTKRTGEGTGLGLSTAYGIVKQTGGYIFCDSEVGKGTTFSLYFPAQTVQKLVRPVLPAPQVLMAPVPHPQRQRSVLLVEDEAPVRAFAARALRLKGYEVHEADSAEEALRLLADDRLTVDVFVTDVVMPGLDGPSWVRTALKDRPATRVIFMSGYTEEIFGEGHAPVPGASFLGKPFTLAELAHAVELQLAAPPDPRQLH